MSVNVPVVPERPENRPFREFMFSIINQMSLDEFKKYTNMPALLQNAHDSLPPEKRTRPVSRMIELNLKQIMPDRKKWRKGGGFNSLNLTNGFYESDTAKRIFRDIYRLKGCRVVVQRLNNDLATRNKSDCDEGQALTSDDDAIVARIDLTDDDPSENQGNPPKRIVKYLRKWNGKNLPPASGIATYTSVHKFVDQIQTPHSLEGFNDEIVVSSTEPRNEAVNHSNEAKRIESAKRIEVINDIVLVPPTPFRDNTIQRSSGPTVKDPAHSGALKLINRAPASKNLARSTPKIGPKSRVPRSAAGVVYTEDESEDLPAMELAQSTSVFSKPKPKASVNVPEYSTQELLHDLMSSQNLSIQDAAAQTVDKTSQRTGLSKPKPKIGPKSKIRRLSKELRAQSPVTETSQPASSFSKAESTTVPKVTANSPENTMQEVLYGLVAVVQETAAETTKKPSHKSNIRRLFGDEESEEIPVQSPVATQEPLLDLMPSPNLSVPVAATETATKASEGAGFSKPKPKIGPKSRFPGCSGVVYMEDESEELRLHSTVTSTNKETSKKTVVSTQKTTITVQAMVHRPMFSPEQLVHNLMHADPSTDPSITTQITPKIKPKIGPKSRMQTLVFRQPAKSTSSLPVQVLSRADPSTSQSLNIHIAQPDEKSTQELIRDLSDTDPSVIRALNEETSEPGGIFGPITPVITTASSSKNSASQSCATQTSPVNQLHFGLQCDLYQIDHSSVDFTGSPASELIKNFIRSFNAANQHDREKVAKYVTENWSELLKSDDEQENDSSAAETQLNNSSDYAEDVEMEPLSPSTLDMGQLEEKPQSQAILSPNQLNVDAQSSTPYADRFQAEPQSPSTSNPIQLKVERQSPAQANLKSSELESDMQSRSQPITQPNQPTTGIQSTAQPIPNELESELQSSAQLIAKSNEIELELQPQTIVNPNSDQQVAEPCDFPIKIEVEPMQDEDDHNDSSDVQIIEMPPDETIEILEDDTQELVNNLHVDGNSSEEQFNRPIEIPEIIHPQPIASYSKAKSPPQPIASGSTAKSSPAPSRSKGFLTSLPNIPTKKRIYPPLEIVVAAAQKIAPIVLPMHDFSQQPDTPPSNENYEIEECTMTDTQHQRYELLNHENTMFLSSQLENYADQTTAANPTPMPNSQSMALKRLSVDTQNSQPSKRRRFNEAIKRKLNWKIMDIRSIIFKPVANNLFHLELQLRNNFDTFHVQDQHSIKRVLHLSDREWQHVVKILSALNGYQYQTMRASQQSDLPSGIMNCFVQSIPSFVSSQVQFRDFMGHTLEVSEQEPLVNKNTEAAIDPQVLNKMKEFRRNLCGENID